MSINSDGGTTAISDYLLNPSSSSSDGISVTIASALSLLEPSLAPPSLISSSSSSTNNNDTGDEKKVAAFNAELMLKVFGIVALIIIIVIGNGMVMLAVRLDRTILALSQSSFLFSMALADALVGIFVLPMALLQIVYEYWPLPPILCILYRCLDVALCTASILHLCAISMDRFWSLRIDYTRHHRSRNMRIMIIVVWLLSLVICLPSALPSKFDLQYLGNYLPSSSDDEDVQRSNTVPANFFISPFYILDVQQQQMMEAAEMAGDSSAGDGNDNNGYSSSPLDPTASTVFFNHYQTKPVTLPPRLRGNNKVLQSVDDVGDIECVGPTPFEWLFPPYEDNDQPKAQQPCRQKTTNNDRKNIIIDTTTIGSSSSASAVVMPYAPAVLSTISDNNDNTFLSATSADGSATDVGLYHCTLINDIFYTFASASMSFYIPLVITIIMNVLTFWIAQRTAKAAIRRMHASNPAALMLRAVIPMPIGRQSNFSATFDRGATENSTMIDEALSPMSIVDIAAADRKMDLSPNKINNQKNDDDDKNKEKEISDANNNNTTTSSGAISQQLNNNEPPTVAGTNHVEVIQPASSNKMIMNKSVSSFRGSKSSSKRKKSFRISNGSIRRSASCKSKANDKKSKLSHHSFDDGVDAGDNLLDDDQNQASQFTTKNLIANVLQNVAFFGARQTIVSSTSKSADDYDRTIHTVRAEKKRRAKQRERKAAVVLIIVTVTFIVCWLPFFTIFPLTKVFEPGVIPGPVFEAAVWLGYVNSAVNPVIYTIFNEEFRRAFTTIFMCRWKQFGRY